MFEKVQQLQSEAAKAIKEAKNIEELEQLNTRFLGRKGAITEILRGLGSVSAEERPLLGQQANQLKTEISSMLDIKKEELKSTGTKDSSLSSLDITVPGRKLATGGIHPLTRIRYELEEIFVSMGFTVEHGPEIETDYYNFEALNTPADHPARDEQDSFYITDKHLLRTQTSTVQIRVMETKQPPIRMIAPGRCYRRDAVDATHNYQFHQIEGLMVDKGITLGDLKGVLDSLVKAMFGEDCKTRFTPHFFPFTEPSAELHMSCLFCKGKGCRVCKNSGWIELGGCGMVDPEVFKHVGYDPEVYSGFAFGFGIERIAMLKYGIDDIRLFFDNDIRFLKQFSEGQSVKELKSEEMNKKMEEIEKKEETNIVDYDTFSKLDIRVGTVISAEKIEKADKLLKLQIDIGEETPRQVVAGIALKYTPEEMVGKRMILLTNLEPRKIRGIESRGMILAATADNLPIALTTDEPVPSGSRVK